MMTTQKQTKILTGNESNMLQGSTQDKYQSKYNSMKPNTRPADSGSMGSNYSDVTMSQINRMTSG